MRFSVVAIRGLLAGGIVLAAGGSATAQELGTPRHSSYGGSGELPMWEIAGKAGYTSAPVRGGTTPFGAGFGGRLGFNVANVYIGGSVVDYLGATDVDVWSHSVLYGAELGYSFKLPEMGGVFFVLRPQMGFGGMTLFRTTPIATSTSSSTPSSALAQQAAVDVITKASGGTSSSSTTSSGSGSRSSAPTSTTDTVSNVYMQPGFMLMLTSRQSFAALNANMLVIPGFTYGGNPPTTWISYGLEAQLGLRF